MSAVSFQNESLPSFEPIEHAPQKRKRATMKDNETQPLSKRSRAKRTISTPSPKSIIWIGATSKIEDGIYSAAYSIYYGVDDSRNFTERLMIQKDQTLDYVYTMGVIRALEKCEDDASILHIHTGSKLLQQAIDTKDDCDIYNQVLEKIAKRKGSTSIRYNINSSTKQDEYKIAHSMANEKLLEDNMLIDENEISVNSLEMKEVDKTEVTTTAVTVSEEEKVEVLVEEVTTISSTDLEPTIIASSVNVEPISPPSWTYALGLHNLLDILKAPFSRKNKQN